MCGTSKSLDVPDFENGKPAFAMTRERKKRAAAREEECAAAAGPIETP
jgi:hypothetical protein